MENRYEALIDKSIELGARDARLIDTDQITFDPRSHLKCRFGCNRWVDSGPVPPI